MDPIPYERFLETAKTGDLVFFQGRGLTSLLIRRAALLPWADTRRMRPGTRFRETVSHVGMVARESDAPMLFESTTLSRTRDAITGKRVEGVSKVWLRSRLDNYKGRVFVRTVKPGHSFADEGAMLRVMDDLLGVGYESSLSELADANFSIWKGNDGRVTPTVFCSEVVVRVVEQGNGWCVPKEADQYDPTELQFVDYSPFHVWGELREVHFG